MAKIPSFGDFKLDKIKKMGSDLVDSVKSGEVANRLKNSVDSLTHGDHKEVLPKDLQNRIQAVEAELKAFREMQKQLQKAGDDLSQSVRSLCHDATAMFADKKKEQPKESQKMKNNKESKKE